MNISEKEDEALKLYASFVVSWSSCFNLTGTKDENDFYLKHITDAITLYPYVEEFIVSASKDNPISFADIGSGEGIPLIPLSVLLDKYDIDFYAIERSHKRCVFLNHVIAVLKNKGYIKNNIVVLESDLKSVKKQFDVITFCALSKIGKIEKDLVRILKPNGHVFASKGTYDNALDELRSLKTLSGEVIKLSTPSHRERTLLKLTYPVVKAIN